MNVMHSVPHQTVTFDAVALKKIVTMEDFYTAVGIIDKIKSGEIIDVQQMWMNRGQDLAINEMCKKNIRKSKKFKHLTDKHLETRVAMDWLCYSPVSVPYIPVNEIWIWSKENYKTALDEYRQWLKEHESEVSLV